MHIFVLIADRIRNIDFGFNENDIDNIDKVIDALHELVYFLF